MHTPELIWDGELDCGDRLESLSAVLQWRRPPEGISISIRGSHALVEASARTIWAMVTWTVFLIMIWFGLISTNWMLLVLSPFMMGAAMMQTWGRISIIISRATDRDPQVNIFEGIGGLGRRIEMPLREIERVEYVVKRGRGGATTWVVMKGATREVKFGQHLNDEQIQFVIAVLLDAVRAVEA